MFDTDRTPSWGLPDSWPNGHWHGQRQCSVFARGPWLSGEICTELHYVTTPELTVDVTLVSDHIRTK